MKRTIINQFDFTLTQDSIHMQHQFSAAQKTYSNSWYNHMPKTLDKSIFPVTICTKRGILLGFMKSLLHKATSE